MASRDNQSRVVNRDNRSTVETNKNNITCLDNVNCAEGFGVGIHLYFLALFLPGYMVWEVTDCASHLNGVGVHLWPFTLCNCGPQGESSF